MKEFPHYVSMPIQEVMANPDQFIIPENLNAIEYLWNMNILTTQTNDYRNEDSWISFGILSKENADLLNEMRNNRAFLNEETPGVLNHHGIGFRVPVVPGTKDTLEDFMPLFNKLQMQDVQRDGYMTLDEFYANYTDCWKEIKNPYLELEPKIEDFGNDFYAYADAAAEFSRKRYPRTQIIRVYDETKATKTLEEYLADAGLLDCYDEEEQKVFLNRRLYEGHMRYKSINPKQNEENHVPHTR